MSKKIAVLVSGGGTNLQALIDAQLRGELGGGKIAAVISTKAGAYALERAAKVNIPGYVLPRKDFESVPAMTAELVKMLRELEIDLVVLAGCMTIFTEELIKAYPNAIMNVHPALIPSFCGKGYYGLRVHEEAIKYGVRFLVQPSTSLPRNVMAVQSLLRSRFLCCPAIPLRFCSDASWSGASGSHCPGQWLCSAKIGSVWKAELLLFDKPQINMSLLRWSG